MSDISKAPRPEIVREASKAIAGLLDGKQPAEVRQLTAAHMADAVSAALGETFAWVELLDAWNQAWTSWSHEHVLGVTP